MKKSLLLIVFLSLLSLAFWSCSDSTEPEETATVSLKLTDAPEDYDEVNISFTEVSAKIDSTWHTFLGEQTTLNLLDYQNGNTFSLGSLELVPGHLIQIRLMIDTANIVVNGVSQELTVPSGSTSGFKLNTNMDVVAGQVLDLVIDFDLGRSIVVTGPKTNPTGYKLQPVFRVADISQTGTIEGVVGNPEMNPIAYVIQTNDTLTSTFVDTANGGFVFSFLPEFGAYKVVVVDDESKSFTQNGVAVTGGQTTDLGTITLQ